MTQIVAAIGPGFLMQASDRLVSLAPSLRPYDPNANKSLILGAVDGVALIGYTGLAYIDGRPTDQWIAETLTGLDLSMGAVAIGVWHRFHDQPLHLMIDRLAKAFEVALKPHPEHDHQVLVVGWTYKPTGSRPTSYIRRMDWRGGIWSVRRIGSRLRPHDRQFWVLTVPHLSKAQMAPLVDAISGWEYAAGFDSIEAELAEFVRGVNRPGVGPDVLSIIVTWHDFPPRARVRFAPAGRFEESFSPWVITPAGIEPPSAECGGPEGITSYGRLDVETVGIPRPSDSGTLLSVRPMPRIPPPSR